MKGLGVMKLVLVPFVCASGLAWVGRPGVSVEERVVLGEEEVWVPADRYLDVWGEDGVEAEVSGDGYREPPQVWEGECGRWGVWDESVYVDVGGGGG